MSSDKAGMYQLTDDADENAKTVARSLLHCAMKNGHSMLSGTWYAFGTYNVKPLTVTADDTINFELNVTPVPQNTLDSNNPKVIAPRSYKIIIDLA